MKFVTLLFSLAALPLIAGAALAATPMSETQMDEMTAGAEGVITVPPMICANCSVSNSSSSSQNGVTTTHGGSTGRGGLFVTTPLAPWGIGTVQLPIIVLIP
jgi:hypothetical protein